MRKNEVFDGEGNLISSVEVPYTSEEILAALKEYRDIQSATYTYKGVPMKLTAASKDDLTTIYFLSLMNPAIPDAQVMAAWQEDGYDTLNITAGDLRADGQDIIAHRQKWWSAYDAVKDGAYETVEAAIAAYDAAVEA